MKSNVGQGCQKKCTNRRIREVTKDNRKWLAEFRAESAELDSVPAFTPVINLLKVQLLCRGFEEQK